MYTASYPLRWSLAALLLLAFCSTARAQILRQEPDPRARRVTLETPEAPSLPVSIDGPANRFAADNSLRFIPNRGQVTDTRGELRPDVLYTLQSRNTVLYFAATRVSYVFSRDEGVVSDRDDAHRDTSARLYLHRMDMELLGADPNVRVSAEKQTTDYTNYYYAQHPDGITRVPGFTQITYHDIYPKVDMVLYTFQTGVKCNFVVRPGGDPSQIRLRYVAADEVGIQPDGGLRAVTPLGFVEEDAPVCFTGPEEMGEHIGSHYQMADGVVSFKVDEYDHAKSLTIDPSRKWATYYGGTLIENLNGGDPTEVDRNGSVYVTGYSRSTNLPTTTGSSQYSQTYGGGNSFGDAFLVKFDGNGTRLWATYYGGSRDEIAHGVSSDAWKNVFITGHTESSDLPVSSNAYQSSYGGGRDAFIVKFDSNGVRLWGTYYGGDDFDDGYGFGVDSTGNVAVSVTSISSGLETSGKTAKPGGTSRDMLLAKFNASGSRVWATYLGGSDEEYGYAVGSDIDDNVIITGWTASTDFPVTTGAFQTSYGGGSTDAFVAKFNTSGTLQWCTYYGGTGTEDEDNSVLGYCGIATDGNKNICITGHTTGSFPTTTGAFQTTFGGGARDAFIVKFNPSGGRIWATYFGGSGEEAGVGCASSPSNSVLITGFTTSTNLPVTADAYQATLKGGRDVFIAKFDSNCVRQWVTYYGGTSTDEGEGISFDPFGSMVVAGHTLSTDFPTMVPWQGTNRGQYDAFALLFCDMDRPKIDTSGPTTICWSDSVVLSVKTGYNGYLWSSGAVTNKIVVKASGKFFVRVTNAAGCTAISDTVTVKMLPKPDPFIYPNGVQHLCEGDTLKLKVGPSQYISYRWSTGATTSSIIVTTAGSYRVAIVDSAGCMDTTAWMTVIVHPKPPAGSVTISPANPAPFCDPGSVTLTASSSSGLKYLWSTGERTASIKATHAGVYKVSIVNDNDCPGGSDSVTVLVYPKPTPRILPLSSPDMCEGDTVVLQASPGYASYRWSTGDTSQQIVAKTGGLYELTVTDDKGCVGTATISVTTTPRPHPKLSVSGSRVFCEGDSVTLDPGPGFLTFRWSTGETTPTIVVKESGKYSVVVADGSNCAGGSDTVDIVVNPAPTVDLNGPEVVCSNSTVEYSVTAQAGAHYDWSVTPKTVGTIVSGQGTPTIQVKWGSSGTGVVSVSVGTDSSSCKATAKLTVTIGNALKPTITASRSLKLCDGDSVRLDAGSGYTTYKWSNGATTRQIWVKDTGTFSVTVTKDSCFGTSAAVKVQKNSSPKPTITASKHTICPGESLQLSTEPAAKYAWSSGQKIQSFTVTAPGNYTVTVTDANGCTGTSEVFTVTLATPPKPVIDGPLSICLNSNGVYSVRPDVAGDTYVWSVTGAGGTIVSGQGTSSITVRWGSPGAGTVSLQQTSAATGCTGSAQPLQVTVGSSLTPVVLTPDGTSFCHGDSLRLQAPSGYTSYVWSTGGSVAQITVGAAGRYIVTVTDAAGCSGSDTVDVTERKLPEPFILPAGPIGLCPGDSAVLSAAEGYSGYLWSTGETTRQIVVRVAGSYSVSASNEDGCRGQSQPVVVFANPAPATPVISVDGTTLTSTPATTYQWYFEGTIIPGGTSRTLVANKLGHYTVSISDGNGCTATSAPAEPIEAGVVVKFAKYDARPGQQLQIPLTIISSYNLDQLGVYRYHSRIRFDRRLLFPNGATPMGIEDGEDRVIDIVGTRPAGLDSGTIGMLDVIAALGDTLTTPLTIESFSWDEKVAAVDKVAGLVRIHPTGGWKLYLSDGRLSLDPVKPNPATTIANVVYETIESGHTQLTIVDVLGRRVRSLVDGEVEKGKYEIPYDTSELPSGNYFLVLLTPTGSALQPLQIQH